MAVDILPALSNVPQQARQLQGQLTSLLAGTPQSPESDIVSAAAASLGQLVSSNADLTRLVTGCNGHVSTAPAAGGVTAAVEDTEEVHAACLQRQQLLQELLQALDAAVLTLRSQLDRCRKLLSIPPCQEDPEAIIRYAHTLRHGFAPLGSAPGLPQVPPAPQLPFMLCSTLRLYNMDLAAQQQQQQQDPVAQQNALQSAPSLQAQQPAAMVSAKQPAADAAELPAAPAAPAPIIDFMLNQDLEDDDGLGELVSDSGDDYDDEDDTGESE